jgi:hypothetical protein
VCFLTHCPSIVETSTPTEVDEAWAQAARHLRSVTATEGPKVISETPLGQGGYLIRVEFILTAAVPHIYTGLEPIATATGLSLALDRPGAAIFSIPTVPVVPAPAPPAPILDPECPVIPVAPRPPAIGGSCGSVPSAFFSYAIYIPEDVVQSARDGVISLVLTTGSNPVRHLRVRMLPRPLPGQQPEDLNPSTACGQFNVNYIPPGTTVTIDGMTERITYRRGAGGETSGEHLVSGVDSELFTWPILTCGLGYYLLIDVDSNVLMKVALSVANRE